MSGRRARDGPPGRNIEVSEEMRAALRAPLTPQQTEELSRMPDGTAVASAAGYVLSHKLKDTELTGVVCVSIDVSDCSGACLYKYSDVKRRITVSRTGRSIDGKWTVTSAERI